MKKNNTATTRMQLGGTFLILPWFNYGFYQPRFGLHITSRNIVSGPPGSLFMPFLMRRDVLC